MAKFWLGAAIGFYLMQLCLAEIGLNISCRYAGVFHVEKNRRYSLTREEATALCEALNSTIPTMEQMQQAYDMGFETCRYGYIQEKIVIPRQKPYYLCAANNTGIYILASNISDQYDTYCFNASETRPVVCEPVIQLYSAWPNDQSIIDISNADGSRYIGGKKYTERPPVVTDDDGIVGSGTANDSGTTDPTMHRTPDDFTHFADGASRGKPYDGNDEDSTPGTGIYDDSRDHSSKTSGKAMVSSNDAKQEDSAHDSLLHGVHSGWDSEVKYSTNETREDVPVDDRERSTAVSSSDGFFKQEDSTQNPLDDSHPGLETGDILLTNTTQDVLHPGFAPSHENDNNLDEESYHTVAFFNESSKHEGSDQDQPEDESHEINSSTNRTIHGVLETLIPPHESDHGSSRTAFTSHDGSTYEETSRESLFPPNDPRGGSENLHPTNSTWEDVHSFTPPSENENQSAHKFINLESNGEMKHEETTQDPLLHGMHPEQDSEDRYPTSMSSEEAVPGIISATAKEHKNESMHTVVVSTGGTDHEDSIHNEWMHEIQYEKGSEDGYSTNISRNDVSGIISSIESKHEKDLETSHTAVTPENGSELEDSTPDPHTVGVSSWSEVEDKYTTNTSREEVLYGIIPLSNEHEHEHSHTVGDSSDGARHEDDATHDSTMHVPHDEWSNEQKYPTNSTKDEAVVGIISPNENDNEDIISHTAVIHSDDVYHEDSTQQPLPPLHQPGQDPEEKYPTNSSRDGILMGFDTNRESEHDPLYTVSPDGAKEEDSTPESVIHDIQKGSEEKYTTNSTEDGLFVPRIVPRISHKNKTDHTAVVTNNEDKNEESTQDPQWHGLQPEWNNKDEHPVNNTRDELIPEVFPEIQSGSERHPTSPTANDNRKSDGHDQDSQAGSPKSQPRMAYIPDWLIIVASLVALALILGVCIAVNSRRRCGQKQKLVINNGKGAIDNKNLGGLNGEASKSQEMTHLVHKELPEDRTGPHDEFLAIDETQNQHDMDLKTGV